MTEHDILDAIGDIDPAYLEEAKRKPAPGRLKWAGFGAAAACFLLVLIFPLGYYHYSLATMETDDYASTSSQECFVYFAQDGVLYYEQVEISGGDAEMFEAWASKNGVKKTIDLRDISFTFTPTGADTFDVTVTVPASLARYFKDEDGALLRDSLKRTIASYRDVEITELLIVYL